MTRRGGLRCSPEGAGIRQWRDDVKELPSPAQAGSFPDSEISMRQEREKYKSIIFIVSITGRCARLPQEARRFRLLDPGSAGRLAAGTLGRSLSEGHAWKR